MARVVKRLWSRLWERSLPAERRVPRVWPTGRRRTGSNARLPNDRANDVAADQGRTDGRVLRARPLALQRQDSTAPRSPLTPELPPRATPRIRNPSRNCGPSPRPRNRPDLGCDIMRGCGTRCWSRSGSAAGHSADRPARRRAVPSPTRSPRTCCGGGIVGRGCAHGRPRRDRHRRHPTR